MGSSRCADAELGAGRGGLSLSSSTHAQERERWLARASNREQWRRLWAAVELADDFSFLVVQVGDAQATAFVGELLVEHTQGEGPDLCRLELGPKTQVSELLDGMRAAPRPCVFWLVSDADGRDLERLFLLLNQKREVVSKLSAGPLVLALHPLAWTSFRRCAPDFWSVHQAVFRFSPGREDVVLERPTRGGSVLEPSRRRAGPRAQASRSWRLSDEDIHAPRAQPFVGREAELRLLSSVLREPGTKVSITGPPGIGKTALVRAVLPWVAGRYPGGVWYVPLDLRGKQARPYAAAILEELLSQLRPGVPAPTELDPLRRQFALTSAHERALFVFEDLDDSELIELLLPGQGASAIVTSRRRPDDVSAFTHVVALAGLSMTAATELLAQAPELPEPEQARVAAQVRGVPLDLRLASKALLHDGELTLDELSDDARTLWAKLALFVGVFRLDDAEAVSSWTRERTKLALDEIVERALIDHPPSTDHYLNHESLRARALALRAERVDQTRRAFARRVLVDWRVSPQDPNIDTAVQWLRSQLREHDLPDEDWAILRAGWDRLCAWTRGSELVMALAREVAQARGDSQVLASVYGWHGRRAVEDGERDEAKLWYQRQVESLIEAGGEAQPAVVTSLIELASLTKGDESRQHAERAVRISDGFGDGLGDLGLRAGVRLSVARHLDDAGASRAMLERAVELAIEAGDPVLQSQIYGALGEAARADGEYERARGWFERVLELNDDDPRTHYALAEVTERAGDLEQAHAAYARALRGFDELGDDANRALTLFDLGRLSIVRGDLRGARRWLEQSLALDEQLDEGLAGTTLVQLARVDRLLGDLPGAVAKLIRAYALHHNESRAVVEELEACYEATKSEAGRADLREQLKQAGLDWDDL